ncbi:MAG: hypothetical protein ACRCWJ_12550, partial [Casimicrobium sp.]
MLNLAKNAFLTRVSRYRVWPAIAAFAVAFFATTQDAHARDDLANGQPRVAAECALDVDGDGRVLPNDVLIAMRVALGITGAAALTNASFGANASRTTWQTIGPFLAGACGTSMSCGLDIDGDTRVLSTTDLLLAL